MSNQQSIIFMGTPEFASHTLKALLEASFDIKSVITAPDRPAGRGQQIRMSAVKTLALEHGLKILQPTNLKDEAFISELKDINADLFVVVAFRMLPEAVWTMPMYGTINLHGSILPNYRGAAPINWAVINGEKETGVTTFFIEKEIDTGKVIDVAKTPISENDTAGTVHDRLMEIGAKLMVKTVDSIFKGQVTPIPQTELIKGELKDAPKIFKQDCKIDWNLTSDEIHNKIRGLSPYPAAWTELENKNTGKRKSLKIFSCSVQNEKLEPGRILIENGKLYFGSANYRLEIIQLQLEGKKKNNSEEFLRGFQFEDWELVVN